MPVTPNACLQGGVDAGFAAPTGSPPRVLPSPPPPVVQAVGGSSAWSYTRQMYRSSPHAARAVEAQALPTSAGVSEPSLYQRSSAPPYYQWAAGSAAGASTSYSHAGAYPAMAVNAGSGGGGGSGGNGTQPPTQPPTQPKLEQPISKNKSPLPKLNIKGGDPTTLTRVINEWIQKTSIALNTWSLEASNFWTQSVRFGREQHNWRLSLAPQDRDSYWTAYIFSGSAHSSASARSYYER